ncbi:MAG: hypothetical protein ACYSWQ_08430 [Planctomycetota bacterium]|jgi:predicted small lipoprotein YifL
MRIPTALVLAGITALAGCGSPVYWYSADKTLPQAKQDCSECYVEAQTEAANARAQHRAHYHQAYTGESLYRNTQFERCMRDRGYRQVPKYRMDATARTRTVSIQDKLFSLAGNWARHP